MEGSRTAGLRQSAKQWSLAGDSQLLDILQELHKKIVTNCQETNRKLNEMVSALDDASISLQNVNNRFMALSNTQFVESRVFDDDDVLPIVLDSSDSLKTEPSSESKMKDEVSNLLEGIKVLESLHEKIPIVYDSDSGSDCEEDKGERYIMKLNDMYSERPLPYVIGTQNWKESWHAGLLKEDSHSALSSPSWASEEEEENLHWVRTMDEDKRLSSSSSSSEKEPVAHSPPKSQSDIAAEIAARLSGVAGKQQLAPPVVDEDKQVENRKPTSVYRPHLPTQATIYNDEPPPLDANEESDRDSYTNEEDDDIFAEINKNAPYADKNKSQSTLGPAPVDIFAGLVRKNVLANDIESNSKQNKGASAMNVGEEVKTNVEQKSTVRTSGQSLDSTADEALKRDEGLLSEDNIGAKKPAGAISLFGTNKSNDSIGAAILRRNMPKSLSSDDDDDDDGGENDTKNDTDDGKSMKQESPKIDKDIFENLFAKPTTSKVKKVDNKKDTVEKSVKTEKKFDLFNDDIFNDDIDSLFAPKVKVADTVRSEKVKSIFDDVDDLFADVNFESSKVVKEDGKPQAKKLDVYDDLFAVDTTPVSDKKVDNVTKSKEIVDSQDGSVNKKQVSVGIDERSAAKTSSQKNILKTKEAEASDDIFSHKNVDRTTKNEETSQKEVISKSQNIFGSDDDIFTSTKSSESTVKVTNPPTGLFGDDEDDNDLFAKIKSEPKIDNAISKNVNEVVSDISIEERSKDDVKNDNVSKVIKDHKIDNKRRDVNTNYGQGNKNSNTSEKVRDKKYIFQESDDEDIFKTKPTTEQVKNTENNNTFQVKPVKNVDDNESSKVLRKSSKSVFDYDEDSDDLFSKKSINTNDKSNKNINFSKKEKTNKGIFDSDSDDDCLFGDKNISNKPKQNTQEKFRDEKGPVSDNIQNINVNNVKTDEFEEKIMETENANKEMQPEIKEKYPVTNVIENISKESSCDDLKSQTANDKESQNIIESIENSQTSLQDSPSSSISKTVFEAPPSNTTVFDTKDSDIFVKHDIFSDVLKDTPPELDKSKEKKKSKNVNALFDDDSDDESLFFKKNDNLIFDQPSDFDSNKNDQLFDIFRDEPPAIDSDFFQRNDEATDDFDQTFEQPPDLSFTITVKAEKPIKTVTPNEIASIDNKPTSTDDVLTKPEDHSNSKTSINSHKIAQDIPITSKLANVDKTDGITQSKEESVPKPVGKLKNINFNINVNTLLPGASPKKTVIPKANDEKPHLEESSEKMLKSLSFDSDPDSLILDNTFSKERPKIQVKRRPSTRRARIEAARKSAIDISDVTDNVDHVNNSHNKSAEIIDKTSKDNPVLTDVSNEMQASEIVNENTMIADIKAVEVLEENRKVGVLSKELKGTEITDTQENKQIDLELNKEKESVVAKEIKTVPKDEEQSSNATKESIKPNASTKILNINDDDVYIFNEPIKTIGQVYSEKSKLQIIDDTDDLFKRTDVLTKSDDDSVKTEYPKSTVEKKSSILDFLSDDEQDLFGGNSDSKAKKSDSKAQKSDSNNDYFKKKVEKPNVVKKSLFDDDDDDDLFGAKIGSKGTTQKTATSKSIPTTSKEVQKSTEPVFNDPLSLFDDDDDD